MRKAKKNVRHEMRSAIMNSFREGMNKRDLKRRNEAEGKVFSYGSKFALLDRVNDFCKTLPKGITLDELKPEHVRAYLDEKAKTCTQATLDEYRSELKRIGACAGLDLGCERIFASKTSSESRGAQSVISKDDWGKILEYCREHPSGSAVALMLENEIGIRVGDMAYGIHVGFIELKIEAKNGKWMTRHITPEIREIINSEAFRELLVGDKWHGPKDGSINKYLSRVEDKLGLERHSFHDIRRRIAQDKYDELRNSGLSRTETLSKVSIWLNHGPNREKMLLKSYIANPW